MPVAKKKTARKQATSVGAPPTTTAADAVAPGKKVRARKAATRKKTAKKAAAKRVTKKKAPPRKVSAKRAAAARRKALNAKLREDLRAARSALREARADAREALKFARESARTEAALLKERLAAALKREQQLITLLDKKARVMLQAGERWERKQLARIKQAVSKTRRRRRPDAPKPAS